MDISRSQLDACRRRAAGRDVWLAQCEAEELPLADRQFDAVLSIGAFNYFNDPEGALREMVRVARPARPIVISDEMPNLTDRMLGHKLGIPALDRWIVSRLMHLGDSFTEMVERHRDLDVPGDRAAGPARMSSSSRSGGASAMSSSGMHPALARVATRPCEGSIRAVHHPDRQERPEPARPDGA